MERNIYVITSGSYSDYGVEAVFMDKEKAEFYEKYNKDCSIEIYEIAGEIKDNKIYIVFRGEYSTINIAKVFTDEDEAYSYDTNDDMVVVEEFELDDNRELKAFKYLDIRCDMDIKGNIFEFKMDIHTKILNDYEKLDDYNRITHYLKTILSRYEVETYSINLKRVLKGKKGQLEYEILEDETKEMMKKYEKVCTDLLKQIKVFEGQGYSREDILKMLS